MNKQSRQFRIKEIIGQRSIASQDELGEVLRKAGIDVTQATLSRDLKEMAVSRINSAEGLRYSVLNDVTDDVRLKTFLSYEIESIEHNESMVVIKTLAGRAQGVAELIDGMNSPLVRRRSGGWWR
jgi:transcriptional regulator of arginine metabolism